MEKFYFNHLVTSLVKTTRTFTLSLIVLFATGYNPLQGMQQSSNSTTTYANLTKESFISLFDTFDDFLQNCDSSTSAVGLTRVNSDGSKKKNTGVNWKHIIKPSISNGSLSGAHIINDYVLGKIKPACKNITTYSNGIIEIKEITLEGRTYCEKKPLLIFPKSWAANPGYLVNAISETLKNGTINKVQRGCEYSYRYEGVKIGIIVDIDNNTVITAYPIVEQNLTKIPLENKRKAEESLESNTKHHKSSASPFHYQQNSPFSTKAASKQPTSTEPNSATQQNSTLDMSYSFLHLGNLNEKQIQTIKIPFTKNNLQKVKIVWNFLSQSKFDDKFKNNNNQITTRLERYAAARLLNNEQKYTEDHTNKVKKHSGAYRIKLTHNGIDVGFRSFFPPSWNKNKLEQALRDASTCITSFTQDINTKKWIFYANTSNLSSHYDFDMILVLNCSNDGSLELDDVYPAFTYGNQENCALNYYINYNTNRDNVLWNEIMTIRNNATSLASSKNRTNNDTLDSDSYNYRAQKIHQKLLDNPCYFSNEITNTTPSLSGKKISLNFYHIIYPGLTKDTSGKITNINGGHHDYNLKTLREGFYSLGKSPDIKTLSSGAFVVKQYIGTALANDHGKAHFPPHWKDEVLAKVIVDTLSNISNFNTDWRIIKSGTGRKTIEIKAHGICMPANEKADFDLTVVIDETSGYVITAYPYIKK